MAVHPETRRVPSATALLHGAESLAVALPPLLVEAERVAATVAQGLHGRRRVGQGEAFWQFRRYQPGDSALQIDWRKSARSAHTFVREREWEAAESVWLWTDASPSMTYRSDGALPSKAERAALLALALAHLLIAADERVGALDGNVPPSSSRHTPQRLAAHFTRTQDGPSLPEIRPLPRDAQLVLIGDFLGPRDETAARLRAFASAGVAGHLLHIFDPAEELFPFAGRVRFEGLEAPGHLVLGRAESVRQAYRAAFDAHRDALRQTAQRIGFTFASHRTDHAPHLALLALYGALARRPVAGAP